MKDFKQTPKMNAEGSHYKTGGKVKKMSVGGSSGPDYNTNESDRFVRGANAANSWVSNLANKGTSDAINIDTYGKPSNSRQVDSAKFVGKALDEADNEKIREHSRGIQTKKRGGSVKRKK